MYGTREKMHYLSNGSHPTSIKPRTGSKECRRPGRCEMRLSSRQPHSSVCRGLSSACGCRRRFALPFEVFCSMQLVAYYQTFASRCAYDAVETPSEARGSARSQVRYGKTGQNDSMVILRSDIHATVRILSYVMSAQTLGAGDAGAVQGCKRHVRHVYCTCIAAVSCHGAGNKLYTAVHESRTDVVRAANHTPRP